MIIKIVDVNRFELIRLIEKKYKVKLINITLGLTGLKGEIQSESQLNKNLKESSPEE